MYTAKILVVEDEIRIRKLISTYLKKEGYMSYEAENGKKALEIWEEESFDLIILDIMLPIYDGWSVCRHIRKESDIPIIMLTARGQEEDKLFGFELGVDDYVTKPFSVKELMARVKSLLKRSGNILGEDRINLENLTIDTRSHKIWVDKKLIELTPKEYDLLMIFINNKNQALTREIILDGVWGYDYYGDYRTVDTHIKRLRKKLETAGDYITTVRGVGYRFEVSFND